MPKLHKIISQGNQVAFSFREWDGIDHPDYTTIVMSLAEAEATLGYFTAAIAAAKREDMLKQERERKELLRQEQQLMQQLQSIQDRLGGFGPLKDSAEDRPESDADGGELHPRQIARIILTGIPAHRVGPPTVRSAT